MNINFKPLGNRVLVERIVSEEEKTSGGIIIPDTAKETPNEGVVVAVGPGQLKDDGSRIPMSVNMDDRVVFGKWGSNEIKIDGKEYLLLKEDDIYGVFE